MGTPRRPPAGRGDYRATPPAFALAAFIHWSGITAADMSDDPYAVELLFAEPVAVLVHQWTARASAVHLARHDSLRVSGHQPYAGDRAYWRHSACTTRTG
jgi:hypothetical protein